MYRREITQRSLHAVSVLAMALASLAFATPAHAATTGCTTSAVEASFSRMVNSARTNNGLRPLRTDVQVAYVADFHSQEMRRMNAMRHTSLRTLGRRITRWRSIGENIGYLDRATTLSARAQARTMFRMFMNSPTHRANILRPGFRQQGVGVVYGGGRLWITHNFATSTDPGTALRRAC